MSSENHKQRLTDLDESIQDKCVNPISVRYCGEFSTPDDISEEEFYFEPIEPQSSKPDSNESANMYDTYEYKGI